MFDEVYERKISKIKNKKFASLNYKILQGILYTAVKRAKWDRGITGNCKICDQPETIIHILYYCEPTKFLWSKIGEVLGSEITLKEIIVGVPNSNVLISNEFLSMISYIYYKKKP